MLPEVDELLCAPELAIMEPADGNLSLPGFVIPGVIGLLLLLPSSSGFRLRDFFDPVSSSAGFFSLILSLIPLPFATISLL